MAEEKKKLFGFSVNDTRLFADTFDTVEELIEFAQKEYDDENDEYFDVDHHCILVSYVEEVCAWDFAPSLDDIADDMTNRYYSEHNLDEDAEVDYSQKDEARKEWKAFINKYFEVPFTLIGYADVGWYDMKKHKWVERYDKKED